MSLIEQRITENGLEWVDKVQIAIARIQEFDPQRIDSNKIYLLPFSGGKDSLVCHELTKLAGVKFKAFHAPTIEFKETYQYLRSFEGGIPQVPPKHFTNRAKEKFRGRAKTMFTLIASRPIPPTRQNPYCCSDLKEHIGDKGDVLITGVRWEESPSRKNRKLVEFFKGKTMLRPIIDWTEDEVWEFIRSRNLPYNPLYDQGFNRIGCPGCPKSKNQSKELEMYPEWKNWYLTAFKHMLENVQTNGTWKSPEDVMEWWLGECETQREKIDGQLEIAPCEMM